VARRGGGSRESGDVADLPVGMWAICRRRGGRPAEYDLVPRHLALPSSWWRRRARNHPDKPT